jgi:hypothetical protein
MSRLPKMLWNVATLWLLLLITSRASGGVIIGPGHQSVHASDEAYNLISVDLNNPVTLATGNYVASLFDYQFANFGFDTTGSITPLLLTGSGTNFTPIAIGDTITYSNPTTFLSAPFGGSDTFALVSSTTVYAGLYWDAKPPFTTEPRMPLGYVGPGNAFVVYGGGFGPGANPPVIGTPISGSAEGFFSRIYDFDIQVEPAPAAVPEPSSLFMALTAVGLLSWSWLRRKRSFCCFNFHSQPVRI